MILLNLHWKMEAGRAWNIPRDLWQRDLKWRFGARAIGSASLISFRPETGLSLTRADSEERYESPPFDWDGGHYFLDLSSSGSPADHLLWRLNAQTLAAEPVVLPGEVQSGLSQMAVVGGRLWAQTNDKLRWRVGPDWSEWSAPLEGFSTLPKEGPNPDTFWARKSTAGHPVRHDRNFLRLQC